MAGPAPLGHAAQRLGRSPAGLVRAVRRDGVVHVADGTHAGMQADLFAAQAMRITAAVEFFVMVQTHIQRDRADTTGAQQHGVARRRVAFDDIELFDSEFVRLVQNGHRQHHLAHVVQQAGQSQFARDGVVQAQLARQRDHQRAHGHRVHIGIVVGGFQPRQADQRAGIADHRAGDLVHQRQGPRQVDRAAHARVLEHGQHRHLRFIDQGDGPLELLGHGRGGGGGETESRRGRRHGGHGRSDGGRPARFGRHHLYVAALAGIDPQLRDGAGAYLVDRLLTIDEEGTLPEWRRQPGADQLVDIHAHAQLPGGDLPDRTGLARLCHCLTAVLTHCLLSLCDAHK